ncbi:Splicing factor-like protein [Parasponia andersonii]|uniref:Splicing factor-like protein n=1 Tax=Parasponia andersonii TaxID=3476 RepID=A0A2P5CR57_PARAD|nr:Splicing factor-like protein [Parasponia andersonii]
MKSSKQGGPEDSETPSNNLWVGNLASDVTDSDLMELFAQYGALDSVTSYSARSYAFLFFKRMEDAKAAKDALQGTPLHGNPIKIEFARPAKPCKHLWVGGISPSVTKEELEEEFLKFGKIEDFKFLRDRNTAFIEFFRLEDASQAMRNMNTKRLGGEQIRVDFLRSQPSRREQWPDPREGQFQGRSMGPADFHSFHKRPQYSQASGGRKGEGQPSNVLWIGYPPSLQIDEQMLHNAMILFGEIERIKSFPSRHYSFVEFRSVDEARRAKEGLQGRLFNDPRISIMFSSSELAPGAKGLGPDMGFDEHTFQPLQMDMYGANRPMISNNFPGPLNGGIRGPNMAMRPLGPQGRFEPLPLGPEVSDLATLPNYQDINSKNLMGPNWRRPSSPAAGVLSSPAPGIRGNTRSASSAWDVLDVNQFQRDSKRSRIDSLLSIEDTSFPLRKIDDHGRGLDQSYALGAVVDGGTAGPFANVQGKGRLSPVGTRILAGGPAQVHPDSDYIWRGIIAKGGTPVCHARCVPVEKGIGSELPEVVNCSARTGLDMLTKHYAEAIGFEIVFFLPDSEDDFASYTEFLRYLGAKNRAGVAKFDDGTTLFLVPPSDFLTKVLKVAGPERLYGVVLKFPQVSSSTLGQQLAHLPIPSNYADRHQIPPQMGYGVFPSKEELVLQMDYGRILHEESKIPLKPPFPPTSVSPGVQPVSQDYASNNSGALSQAGVALTPELIATLASLMPANAQSSVPENAKASGPMIRHSLPSVAPNKVSPPGWKQDHHQTSDHTVHGLQQLGSQFNPQGQSLSQLQSYPSVSNTPSHPAQLALGSTQFQDSSLSQSLQSRLLSNFPVPSQGGQSGVTSHLTQHQPHGTDASGLYNPTVPQQLINPVTLSGQSYSSNSVQSQTVMPIAPEKVNADVSNQVQQLHSAILGAGQGTSEGEVDKNQRYQSTLQFAANLLLQIQQQQQQQHVGAQAGRSSGSQQ